MRLTIARLPKLTLKKLMELATISGWGERDVRISVPFTRDIYHACKHGHANSEIMQDCHVTCSEH